MGDFIGFTFNGVRSTDLGILRVSDGDRYKNTLYPDIKDLSAEVNGKNGEYYFGNTYGTRHFNLNLAYDSMTEEQMRRLIQLFGRQQIGSLIFDEEPYKKYLVKVENPIELSYICFDDALFNTDTLEGGGIKGRDLTYRTTRKINSLGEPAVRRLYKGEGTIDLIGYYPFAKSCFKVLPAAGYKNIDEWAEASKILNSEDYHSFEGHGFDTVFEDEGSYKAYVYNAGDLETSCRIYCPFSDNGVGYTYENLEINYSAYYGAEVHSLVLKGVEESNKTEDIGFLINTETGLIQGVESITYDVYDNPTINTSTSLYNKYVAAGEFFKLQPNLTYTDKSSIIINGGNESIQIFYDYLYF